MCNRHFVFNIIFLPFSLENRTSHKHLTAVKQTQLWDQAYAGFAVVNQPSSGIVLQRTEIWNYCEMLWRPTFNKPWFRYRYRCAALFSMNLAFILPFPVVKRKLIECVHVLYRPLHFASWYGRPTNPVGSSSGLVVVQLQSRTWPSASKHLRRPRTNRSLGSKVSQHQSVAPDWFGADEYHQRYRYTGTERVSSMGVQLHPFLQ